MSVPLTNTPIITGQVPLASFNLFPQLSTSTTPFDVSKLQKFWAAPAGFDFTAHGIQQIGGYLIFPFSLGASGQLEPLVVPLADVFALNIPTASAAPGQTILSAYAAPLDPLRWDSTNYYLVNDGFATFVRDHRSDESVPIPYTVGADKRLVRIESDLQALMTKFQVS